MKRRFFIIWPLAILTVYSCEKKPTITPRINRIIASEHIDKIDGSETFSKGTKEYLNDEQSFPNIILENLASDSSSAFSPENNPKFPLPYYLVPAEDAHFVFADNFAPEIADQLVMKISGKKHYKLFVHPAAESHYDFLRSAYNYIGGDQTEFFASPTSDYRSLVVWNKNGGERKPFIVKVSFNKNAKNNVDHLVSENEIERSIAAEKAFEKIGEKKLNAMNLKIFPESAGLSVDKIHPGAPKQLGGQLISEIPDEIIHGEKKWFSISALLNPARKPQPLIMDIIKQSGLSSTDFIKTYIVDGYLKMFEEISLKNGINFEPNPQSLVFETSNYLKPTGKWIFKDFRGVLPDIITMEKNKGPLDIYMENSSATKFNLRTGRANAISNYVLFYKPHIFNQLIAEVAKHDSALTAESIQDLNNIVNMKFTRLINAYLGLNLKSAPNINDYKQIEETVIALSELDDKITKKEIKENENLKVFIENKKDKNEWIEFSVKKAKSKFYLTDHGLYEISSKKIMGFALFNHDELEEYKANDKMLTIFNMLPVEAPDKTSCFGMIPEFFTRTKKP